MTNESLVFDLIWDIAIHPRYMTHKTHCANDMHRIICSTNISTKESTLDGMMEIIEYVSNCILIEYGFATPWYRCNHINIYYPMHIEALDLAFNIEYKNRQSNTLGGFRV